MKSKVHRQFLGASIFKCQGDLIKKLCEASGSNKSEFVRTALHWGLLKLKNLDPIMIERFIISSERDLVLEEFGAEVLQDTDSKIMEEK